MGTWKKMLCISSIKYPTQRNWDILLTLINQSLILRTRVRCGHFSLFTQNFWNTVLSQLFRTLYKCYFIVNNATHFYHNCSFCKQRFIWDLSSYESNELMSQIRKRRKFNKKLKNQNLKVYLERGSAGGLQLYGHVIWLTDDIKQL